MGRLKPIKMIFTVTLENETGIVFHKNVSIKRCSEITASNYLKTKYPFPYFVERYS